MNALVLFLFARLFLQVARPVPIGQATLLAIALLSVPLVGHTLMDFRPDMICGRAIIAVGTLWIVLREDWISSGRDQVLAGIIFAMALWAKPSVFHLTIILFGSAMLLASLRHLYRRELWEPMLAMIVTVGTAVVLSLPYYFLKLSETLTYIWQIALGPQAHVWYICNIFTDHLLFYLIGLYGGQSLGDWLYVGMLLGALIFFVAWRSRDRVSMLKAGHVVVLILVAYMAVTVPALKGPHGFPFAAIFLGGLALSCVTLADRLGRMLGWALCIVLVAFAVWQFKWDYQLSYPGRLITADFAQSRWSMIDEAMKALGPDVAGKRLLQTTSQT